MDLQLLSLTEVKSEYARREDADGGRAYLSQEYCNAVADFDERVDAGQDDRCQPKATQKSANSKQSNNQSANAPSSKKDWRFCHHAGCTKYRQCSQQNVFKYCATHMPLYGLKLKLFAPKMCKVEDCTKVVTKGPDGTRAYCKLHLEELLHGVRGPLSATISVPQRPARKRRAPSSLAENNFLQDMSDEEPEPNSPTASPTAGGAVRRAARSFPSIKRKRFSSTSMHELCVKDEQSEEYDRHEGARVASDDGMQGAKSRRLPAYLASIFTNGDEAEDDAGGTNAGGPKSLVRAPPGMGHPNNSQRCRHPGCCKYAQYSVQKVRLYCSQHMRAHGLEPMNWDKQPFTHSGPQPSTTLMDTKQLDNSPFQRGTKRKARPSISVPLSPQSLPPLPLSDPSIQPNSQHHCSIESADPHHLVSKRIRLRSPRSSASTATQLDVAATTTNTTPPSQNTPTNTPNSCRAPDPPMSLSQPQHNACRALVQFRSTSEDHHFEPMIARAGSGTLSQPDSGETGVGEDWEQKQDEKDQDQGGAWSLRSLSARNKQQQASQKRKAKGGPGATPKHCQAGGCTKQVQTCVDGSRLFCWVHMRERGLTPMYLNYNPGMGGAKKRGNRGHRTSANAETPSQQQVAAVNGTRQAPGWLLSRTGRGELPCINSNGMPQKAAVHGLKAEDPMETARGGLSDNEQDNEQDQGSGSEAMHRHAADSDEMDVRALAVSSSRVASQAGVLAPLSMTTYRVVKTTAARSVRPSIVFDKEAVELEADAHGHADQEVDEKAAAAKGSSLSHCRNNLARVDFEAAAILEQLAGNRHAIVCTAFQQNVSICREVKNGTVDARGSEMGQEQVDDEGEGDREVLAGGGHAEIEGREAEQEEEQDYEEQEKEQQEKQEVQAEHSEREDQEPCGLAEQRKWVEAEVDEELQGDEEEGDQEEEEEHQLQQGAEQLLLRDRWLQSQREVAHLRAKLQWLKTAAGSGPRTRQGTCGDGVGPAQSSSPAAQVKSLAARVSSLEMELDRSRSQCRKLEEKLERSWAQSAELEAELRRTVQEHQQLKEELESSECSIETEKKMVACSLAELQAECRLLRSQQRQLQQAEESARALLQEQQEQWKRREAALQGQVRAFREENIALQKALQGITA